MCLGILTRELLKGKLVIPYCKEDFSVCRANIEVNTTVRLMKDGMACGKLSHASISMRRKKRNGEDGLSIPLMGYVSQLSLPKKMASVQAVAQLVSATLPGPEQWCCDGTVTIHPAQGGLIPIVL